jgi:hypothetical protein
MLRFIATTGTMVLLATAQAAGFDATDKKMLRTFFTETDVGSIGYIPSATTREAAGSAHNVYRIQDGACEILPIKSRYWFRLNHYQPERTGAGYFSVRILVTGTTNREGELSLFRNADWYRLNNGKVKQLDLLDRADVEMGVPEFLAFHHRETMEPDEVVIGSEVVSQFHASLVPPDPSDANYATSWDDRRLLIEIEDDASPIETRLLVQNLRFDWTDNKESKKAPVFYIDRGDAAGAHIFVSIPGAVEGEGEIEVRLSFGGTC